MHHLAIASGNERCSTHLTDSSGNALTPLPKLAANVHWAAASVCTSYRLGLLPRYILAGRKGYLGTVSRKNFARSLAALDALRAARTGDPSTLSTVATGAQGLHDTPPTSLVAREVRLGWLRAPGKKARPNAPVTANEASLGVVDALGLGAPASQFAIALRSQLPGAHAAWTYAAAQVYARYLGLRYNDLVGNEQLEVSATQPLHVVDVAYMIANAANASPWQLDGAAQYEQFSLPKLGPNQRRVLDTAVHLIGYPYVWGGESESATAPGHAGFDCSGLVWRSVWHSRVASRAVAPLGGRTSMAMSAEMSKRARIRSIAKLHPADLMFFGYHGGKSTPAQNYHVALYMGNGWLIQSSGSNDGVTIDYASGWYADSFSWGRKVLKQP